MHPQEDLQGKPLLRTEKVGAATKVYLLAFSPTLLPEADDNSVSYVQAACVIGVQVPPAMRPGQVEQMKDNTRKEDRNVND